MDSIFRSVEARRTVIERQRALLERWPDASECYESRPSFNTDAYALWIDDVLDGLDVADTAIVGASLGGWLGFDYAIRRPTRINRLAALVPAGLGRTRLLPLLTLLLAPFGKRGHHAAAEFVLGPSPQRPDPPALAELHDALRDYLFEIQDSYRPRRDRLPIFPDDHLRALTMPVLVIAGANDRLIDSADTARRLARLPHAVIELQPGVGHIPTNYAATIHTFLTDTSHR